MLCMVHGDFDKGVDKSNLLVTGHKRVWCMLVKITTILEWPITRRRLGSFALWVN